MAALRVLIVDDDSVYLNVMSRMLDRAEYEAFAVTQPRQAIEIVKNGSIDLVLADVVMPEMRGTELVRQIAQISPQTVSVLLTGMLSPADTAGTS